jgi:hypothetical protein
MGMFHDLAEVTGWRRRLPEVEKGGVYSRSGPNRSVEQATVLSFCRDHRGIPHVTYQMVVGRDDAPWMSSQRTLTLSAFVERYHVSATAH